MPANECGKTRVGGVGREGESGESRRAGAGAHGAQGESREREGMGTGQSRPAFASCQGHGGGVSGKMCRGTGDKLVERGEQE